MSARFLAFDLGAESGRAMIGRLDAGVLTLEDVCRFPNEPVQANGSLHWDILRLWLEMRRGLERVSDLKLDSVGVDTWGCDYALLSETGTLLENPYHYRDTRTDGMMDQVFERVPPDRIYSITGVQFIILNTLYQLFAACQKTPSVVQAAGTLSMIPDLLNYWLTGELKAEFTTATTTQFIDAAKRAWATDLLSELDIPTRLLPPLVEPGVVIGKVKRCLSSTLAGTPVVAPASHDTGSAMASVHAGGTTAFISSGTWSLLGTELPAPIITPHARQLNFTNEGGVCGTSRLLKNITGMWLLQRCRQSWAAAGQQLAYDDLIAAAASAPGFVTLLDPDNRAFFQPADMLQTIADYCRQTDQPVPNGQGACARAILESLAFKYRVVLDSLEELTGARYEEIRIVGGGSKNRLLNQFTADATGRPVVAGPAEATVLGNIALQMLATGAVTSLKEARQVIERSFPVERFEPRSTDAWLAHYPRFQQYLELSCV